MDTVDEMEIVSTSMDYELLLKSFETLELRLSRPDVDDFSKFLPTNESCIDKVLNLIKNEEDPNSSYFLALLQIKDSLYEQRNLLLNLCGNEEDHLNEVSSSTTNNPTLPYISQQNVSSGSTLPISKSIPAAKKLEDIVGLTDVKEILKEIFIYPNKFPQVFVGSRKPWNCVLLYGPPGTGKTFISNAVAADLNIPFYSISNSDLLSKYIGESEKLIHDFFVQTAQCETQSIILIDEIDSLCKIRTSEEADHTRRIKTQLLTEIQNLNGTKTVLIATTNCPWDIDSAFLRRFQRKIYVPLPGNEERKEILTRHMKEAEISISHDEWTQIIQLTDGYSGSDLAILANFVLYEPVRDLENSKYWILSPEGYFIPSPSEPETSNGTFFCDISALASENIRVRSILFKDFQKGIKTISKSVTAEEIQKFQHYNCTL